jgi:hypothetical protein
MPGYVLRDPHYGSGVGFCYDIDRPLFRSDRADGPLVIALDTNVVIDTMEHGTAILDTGEYPGAVSASHRAQLDAWGEILELWLARDIRLIALPGMRKDHRKPLARDHTAEKDRQLRAVEDALTFQLDDWGAEGNRFPLGAAAVAPATQKGVEGALSKLDADLVIEAARFGVDVFLTQDKALLSRLQAAGLPGLPNVLSPIELALRLEAAGLLRSTANNALLLAGHLPHLDCIYAGGMPMGDTGKWSSLLTAIYEGR